MKFKNILILYKRSAYSFYFLHQGSSLSGISRKVLDIEKKNFERAHDIHYKTLKYIHRILMTHGVAFTECYRGKKINYRHYDLIITVGGDGTFLEAARNSHDGQVLLGINSAPGYSIGRFCSVAPNDFEGKLGRLLKGKFLIKKFNRLRVQFDKKRQWADALNDVLVCHVNPAAMCRYYLTIGQTKENQRSSGIWISTAAGSTGAVLSAGGKKLPPYDNRIQYKPRELHQRQGYEHKLRGGVLDAKKKIMVTSLMRRGMIYVDGAHMHFPFDFGSEVRISNSPNPIKTIVF